MDEVDGVRPEDFEEPFPGRVVAFADSLGKAAWAFVPDELPVDIAHDEELTSAAISAAIALGRLDGAAMHIQNPALFLRPFISREALASSRIEGTRADYNQLVLFEASGEEDEANPDIQEVRNYIDALFEGWSAQEDRAFSPGFIMDLHRILLSGVRGEAKSPGMLRQSHVFIGGPQDNAQTARFIPPPPSDVRPLLENLCVYVEEEGIVSPLIRVAIAHYQFEAIHPFLDGNGRLGRLLIPLWLHRWGQLSKPILYVSEFFEHHRDEYIDHLYRVSQRGAWKEWILFTLRAIEVQAIDAQKRSARLWHLREQWLAEYRGGSTGHIIDALFSRPAISIKRAADYAGITPAAAGRIIKKLEEDGVVTEATGGRRNRVFLATEIADIILQPADYNPVTQLDG